jgi:ATP-dependent Lon protease
MNTEKLEKLEKFKKQLDNKLIPDGVKDKIRNEIEKLESEIKSE